MGFLRSWVINIAVLSVVLVLIEMLSPSGKLKNVLGMISGFLLIITVLNPFLGMLHQKIDVSKIIINAGSLSATSNKELKMPSTESVFSKDASINKTYDSNLENVNRMKDTQNLIVKVYKHKLVNSVKELLQNISAKYDYKVGVSINENYGNSKFGEIKKISVEAIYKTIENKKNNQRENLEKDENIKIKIQERISDFLEIDKKIVEINIREV